MIDYLTDTVLIYNYFDNSSISKVIDKAKMAKKN